MKGTLFDQDTYLYSFVWHPSNASQVTATCMCSALEMLKNYRHQVQVQIQCWDRPAWYHTAMCKCMEGDTPETIAATMKVRVLERCSTAYNTTKDESHTNV